MFASATVRASRTIHQKLVQSVLTASFRYVSTTMFPRRPARIMAGGLTSPPFLAFWLDARQTSTEVRLVTCSSTRQLIVFSGHRDTRFSRGRRWIEHEDVSADFSIDRLHASIYPAFGLYGLARQVVWRQVYTRRSVCSTASVSSRPTSEFREMLMIIDPTRKLRS